MLILGINKKKENKDKNENGRMVRINSLSEYRRPNAAKLAKII